MFPGPYILYGSRRSFFTAKVENMLRFLDLPYELVEKQPHDGSDIEKRADCGAIPLLRTPEDWVIWDSTPIAQLLDGRFRDQPLVPGTPVQRVATRLLEDWVDEWFTRPAMYTRWNFPESVEAVFGGGAARALLGKSFFDLTAEERSMVRPVIDQMEPFRKMMAERAAPRGAMTLETGKDIPEWFGAFLEHLASHLKQHPFLLGERPCVADFALNGGLQAHFVYDPWPRRFVEERAPSVIEYAERCWNAKAGAAGWLPEDRLPESWSPFFEEIEARYLRFLLANRESLAAGDEEFTIDLGHGEVEVAAVAYKELSRLDIRGEILALDAGARNALRASTIPKAILDAYLLPALSVPDFAPGKRTILGA
jgi:glutathione S-transferase